MSKEKALKSARRWREDADLIGNVYKVGRALDNMSSYLLSSDFEELEKANGKLIKQLKEERDRLLRDLEQAQRRIDTVSEMAEKVDRERVLYRDTLKGIERLASRWRTDDKRPDVVLCGRAVRAEFRLNGVDPESLN